MTGLNSITDRIIADAEEQAAQKLAEAEARAAEIKKEYDAEKARVRDAAKKGKAQALADMRERHKARLADIERSELLAARREAAAELIAAAKERIINMPDAEYGDCLAAIFKAQCTDEPGEILLSKRDLERLGADFAKKLSDKLTLSGEYAPSDGFIIRYGRVEQNCTIDELFRDKESELFDIACK